MDQQFYNQYQPPYQGQPIYQEPLPYNNQNDMDYRMQEEYRLQNERLQQLWEERNKKKEIGRLSRVLIYYTLAMSVPSFIYLLANVMYLSLKYYNNDALREDKVYQFTQEVAGNGWLYIFGLALGFLVLLIYRRKKLFTEDVAGKRGSMKVSTFLLLLILLLTPNTFVTMFSLGSEVFLNLFGYTCSNSIFNIFSTNNMSVSMLLYVVLLGPIMEEVLFRGVLLHRLEKYGKVFAISISAICFGIFHGNLTQGLFAVTIGFLLGYVALEYSVKWSIVLHIFNNGLSMVLDMLINHYTDISVEFISFLAFAVITVIGLILLFAKRGTLNIYKEANPTVPHSKKLVFGNAWFIVFVCMYFLTFVIYWSSAISSL